MPEQEMEVKPLESINPEVPDTQKAPLNDSPAKPENSLRTEPPTRRDGSASNVKPFRLEEPAFVKSPATPESSTFAESTKIAEQPQSQELPVNPPVSAVSDEPVSREEFEKLKAERDQLVDRLARLQAEFENARKRAERERVSDREFSSGQVIEQFLPVVDNFELALKSDGTAEQLRSGVELIVKKMEDVLRQLHVHAIPAVGTEFDPRVHEALGTVERDDLPDQQVAEEIRRGYKLRQRLLRPALVRVVSNPKQKSE
ncbi:MAG: nucleotide exchange factor GrpE [Terracidiphilus sp.]